MEKKKIALLTLILGIVIFGVKLGAFFISSSVALLSDALESIVNIAASGLMFFSIRVSEKSPDVGHEYGHQKIEDLSSLIEGIFMIIAALFIVYTAAGRLFEPIELLGVNTAIGISIVATALNAGLSWLLFKNAKSYGSMALEGDAKHLFSDVISTAGVWAGLLFAQLTGWKFLDSILAFGIAAWIGWMATGLVFTSSNRLMDKSCREEEKKIIEILNRHEIYFVDFHNLKTRRHGTQVFAELHLCVNGSQSVKETHDFTDHLEEELKDELPKVNLTIHVEPERN